MLAGAKPPPPFKTKKQKRGNNMNNIKFVEYSGGNGVIIEYCGDFYFWDETNGINITTVSGICEFVQNFIDEMLDLDSECWQLVDDDFTEFIRNDIEWDEYTLTEWVEHIDYNNGGICFE